MVAQSQARRPHSAPSLMPATASVVSLLVRGAMVGSSHSATAHDAASTLDPLELHGHTMMGTLTRRTPNEGALLAVHCSMCSYASR